MNYLKLFILTCFLLQTSLFSFENLTTSEQEEICSDKLASHMKELFESDKSNILIDSFNLASLKLAYKQLDEGMEKKTLEDYVSKKMKSLNDEDKKRLRERVRDLYLEFGQKKDLLSITGLINDLDNKNYYKKAKRLTNEESSAFMLALDMMQECKPGQVCIDKNDAAITWFMHQLQEKSIKANLSSAKTNLMQVSVKVAHMTGIFQNTLAHDPDELLKDINELEARVKTALNNHKISFFEEFEFCKAVLDESRCFKEEVKEAYSLSLNEILKNLDENEIEIKDRDLKVQFSDAIHLNLQDSLSIKKVDPPPAPREEQFDINQKVNFLGHNIKLNPKRKKRQCAGEDFEEEVKEIHAWGFDISKAYSKSAKGKGKGAYSKDIFGRFCDPLPWFKCKAFLKTLILSYSHGEAKTCCEDSILWKDKVAMRASIYGGIEVKAGLNLTIPVIDYDLIGAGLLLGFGLSISGGYANSPEKCEEVDSAILAAVPTVYGGIYLDILDGMAGGELKVSWRPHVSVQQKFSPRDSLPPAIARWKVGTIWLQGTLHVSWIVTYNYYKPIFESHIEDTIPIAIF